MFLQVPISKTTYLCKTSMHIFSTEFVLTCTTIRDIFQKSLTTEKYIFPHMPFPQHPTKLKIRFHRKCLCSYFVRNLYKFVRLFEKFLKVPYNGKTYFPNFLICRFLATFTKLQIRFRTKNFISKYFFQFGGPLKYFPVTKILPIHFCAYAPGA